MDESKYQKLLAIEVRMIKKRVFLRGLLLGFVLALVLLSSFAGYFWMNRSQYAASAVDYVAGEMLWKLFRHFPDGYVTRNRDRVVEALDNFTNAASYGRITKKDFRAIADKVMASVKDRKMTYQEIDAILELMNEAAGKNTRPHAP